MNVGEGRRVSTHSHVTQSLVQQRVSLSGNCVKTTRKVAGVVKTVEDNDRQISANKVACVEFVRITSSVGRVVFRVKAADSYQGKLRFSYRTPTVLTFVVFILSTSKTNAGYHFNSIMTASFRILASSLFTSLSTSDASLYRLSY
jgi:hypothetical protein